MKKNKKGQEKKRRGIYILFITCIRACTHTCIHLKSICVTKKHTPTTKTYMSKCMSNLFTTHNIFSTLRVSWSHLFFYTLVRQIKPEADRLTQFSFPGYIISNNGKRKDTF